MPSFVLKPTLRFLASVITSLQLITADYSFVSSHKKPFNLEKSWISIHFKEIKQGRILFY